MGEGLVITFKTKKSAIKFSWLLAMLSLLFCIILLHWFRRSNIFMKVQGSPSCTYQVFDTSRPSWNAGLQCLPADNIQRERFFYLQAWIFADGIFIDFSFSKALCVNLELELLHSLVFVGVCSSMAEICVKISAPPANSARMISTPTTHCRWEDETAR